MKRILTFTLFTGLAMQAVICTPPISSNSHAIPSIFDTLSTVQEYATSLPEYPKPDSPDWENPNFSLFHRSLRQGFLSSILERLGLIHPLWSIDCFKKITEEAIAVRELNGYIGRFVQKIAPTPASQFIIIGDLHGAFHSLVRDLTSLKEMGIIDEDLTMVKPDHYLIFNGNVVSRSPYIIQTLTLIIRLMINNPHSVIYVKGEHEDNEYWIQYGLKRELLSYASSYNNDTIPLQSLIDHFFKTLPLALYLVGNRKQNVVDLVRISGYKGDFKELNENYFSSFFTQKNLSIWNLAQATTRELDVIVNLRAIIRGEEFFKAQYLPTRGLQAVGKEKGATSWTILSSPTESYQKLFDFFFDAFVILTTFKTLNDWTLSLFNQDIHSPKGITFDSGFNLITGVELSKADIIRNTIKAKKQSISFLNQEVSNKQNLLADIQQAQFTNGLAHIKKLKLLPTYIKPEKVTPEAKVPPTPAALPKKATEVTKPKEEILFGSAMDLTRGVRDLCLQVRAGIEMVFNMQNEKGGINNKKLSFIALDDEYTPRKTPTVIKTLMDIYNIDKLLDPVGSPTLETYVNLIKEGKLLVLFPITGNPTVRLPDLKYIIHYRSSYIREGEALAKYAVENLKAKKIALFYQSDVPSIEGVLDYFKKVGFKDYFEVVYKRGVANMEKQVEHINQENPESIIFLAIPTAATNLIRQAGVENIAGKQLLGWSDLAGELFQKFAREKGIKLIISNVVPSPLYSQLPIVQQFREMSDKLNIVKDTFALEGFICAKIIVEILKQIKDEITKEKIIEIAESFKDFDLEGLKLSFNWKTRELCPTIWLDTILEKDWKPITFKVPPPPEKSKKQVEKPKKLPSTAEETLTIATSIDLSRGIKVLGDQIKRTTDIAFEKANNQKAIPGINLRLIALDDEYNPEKARSNVEQIIKQKLSTILLSPLGSDTFNAYLDLIKANKILALFPIPGIPYKRHTDMTYCIYFRPAYGDEARVLTNYALENFSPRKVALFYQNDLFGKACIDNAKPLLDEKEIPYIELPYDRNDVNFENQINKIKRENPDVIFLFAVPNAARSLTQGLGDQLLLEKKFLGTSDLGHSIFRNFARAKGLKYVVSNIVPDPEKSTLPLAKEYRDAIAGHGIPVDTFSLEAYINASILINILKDIEKPITPEKIITSCEKMKNYNLKGLTLNFDPETRQLSNSIWFDTGKGEWKKTEIKQSHKQKNAAKSKNVGS